MLDLSNLPAPMRSRKLLVTLFALVLATVLELVGTLSDAWVNLAVYVIGAYMLGNVGTRAVVAAQDSAIAIKAPKQGDA